MLSTVDAAVTVVWQDIKKILARHLPPQALDQWFRSIEIKSWNGSILELGVPNIFFKKSIECNYRALLDLAAQEAYGCPVQVRISISSALFNEFRKKQDAEKALADKMTSSMQLLQRPLVQPPSEQDALRGVALNPDFTFENFAVGSRPPIYYAAALEAAHNPGTFSRVCLYGQHGTGKTHLLQAVCHAAKACTPSARIVYTTAEKFMSEFMAANDASKGKKHLEDFKLWYRNCDLLAVDDLQFLGAGERKKTQLELCSVMEDLAAGGAQVITACTKSPLATDGLCNRLRDLLSAGLVNEIPLPDKETRRLAAQTKLLRQDITLPADLLSLLADETNGNMRQLEGVLNRLTAQIRFGGAQPTVTTVREALEIQRPAPRTTAVTYKDVIDTVAAEYGVTPESLTSRKTQKILSTPRKLAIMLCRRLVGGSLDELGQIFGNRKHSSISTLLKRIDSKLFSQGSASLPLERILVHLGVNLKPSDIFDPTLFD